MATEQRAELLLATALMAMAEDDNSATFSAIENAEPTTADVTVERSS